MPRVIIDYTEDEDEFLSNLELAHYLSMNDDVKGKYVSQSPKIHKEAFIRSADEYTQEEGRVSAGSRAAQS